MSQQKLNEKKFKIYKYVLFYSLLYLLFFSTLSNVVNDLGYEFLIWFQIAVSIVGYSSVVIGIAQIIYEVHKDDNIKNLERNTIISVCFFIFCVVIYILCKYWYLEETIFVDKNNVKIVEVYEKEFLGAGERNYYKYKNIFVREKIATRYKGEKDYSSYSSSNTTYKEEPEEIKVNLSNLLLKVQYYEELVGIEYMGNSLGQKTVIRVVSTQDSGKTWKCKIEKFLVNNGAKFTEINGKIYINNMGIISYGSQNSILLVSENKGENFIETKIEIPEDIFAQEIEDVPYLNNGIYEFKAIDYDGNKIKYNSEDGIEWKLVK